MELLNANVGSTDGAFQETPEVLQAISVNSAVHVSNSMVDHLVGVFASDSLIGQQGVAVECRFGSYMLLDCWMNVLLPISGDNFTNHFAATLQCCPNRLLSLWSSGSDSACFLGKVHIPRLATDKSFVHFYFASTATEFHKGTLLHCQTNAMQH